MRKNGSYRRNPRICRLGKTAGIERAKKNGRDEKSGSGNFVYLQPAGTYKAHHRGTCSKRTCSRNRSVCIFRCGKKDADKGKVQEIRDYVKSVQGFRQVELTAREQNYGLAKNVIEGVTAIVNKYGKVIVLEDDLVTNRYFLLFMNDGLDRYQNEQKVTGITGFSHFGDTFSYPCESYFNTLSGTSWSWATWSDRWKYFDADCDDWTDMVSDKKLRKAFNYDNTYDFYKIMKMQKTDEKTNSWAIRWYWTNFRKQGLILSPTKSLVSNEGWDGTGIHCGNEKGPVFDHKLMTDHRITEFPQEICEKPELHKAMKKH